MLSSSRTVIIFMIYCSSWTETVSVWYADAVSEVDIIVI